MPSNHGLFIIQERCEGTQPYHPQAAVASPIGTFAYFELQPCLAYPSCARTHKATPSFPSVYFQTYTIEEAQSLAGDGDYVIDRQAGEKMAASYVNFYIANRAIIVPQFGVPETDANAIRVLEALFSPERKVIGISSREILIGGGNIHCITQQVPCSSTTTSNR